MNLRANSLVFLLVVLTLGCVPRLYLGREAGLEYPVNSDDLRVWAHQVTGEVRGVQFQPRYFQCDSKCANLESDEWIEVLSFVHVSDVQVRDFAIQYHHPFLSRAVDRVVKGTQRVHAIDKYDEYPYLALVHTINDLPFHDQPDFMIHTGDAIEASTTGELLRFLSISNQLNVPWYSVIGNHDIFVFGNFAQDYLRVDRLSRGFELIAERQEFMQLHGGEILSGSAGGMFAGKLTGIYGQHFCTNNPDGCIEDGARLLCEEHKECGADGKPKEISARVPASMFHGFDLNGGRTRLSPYYAFDAGEEEKVRVIVLDTTVDDIKVRRVLGRQFFNDGAVGYVGEDQTTWLLDELTEARHRGQVAIVFGHHQLSWGKELPDHMRTAQPVLYAKSRSAGRDVPLQELLKKHDHVIGYFGGHTHHANIQKHASHHNDLALLEVIAPSIHEFPQAALNVSLWKHRENDRFQIHVRPFEPEVGPEQTAAAAARAEMMRKKLETSWIGSKSENPTMATQCQKPSAPYYCRPHFVGEVGIAPRDSPTAILVDQSIECPGDRVPLKVELRGVPPFALLWSDGLYQQHLGRKDLNEISVGQFELVREVAATDKEQKIFLEGVQDAELPGITGGGMISVPPFRQPNPRAEPDSICLGDSFTLSSGNKAAYEWEQGTNTFGPFESQSITPDSPGEFRYVMGRDCFGDSYQIRVRVKPKPSVTAREVYWRGLIRLQPLDGATEVTWSDGRTGMERLADALEPLAITEVKSRSSGCTASERIEVRVRPNLSVETGGEIEGDRIRSIIKLEVQPSTAQVQIVLKPLANNLIDETPVAIEPSDWSIRSDSLKTLEKVLYSISGRMQVVVTATFGTASTRRTKLIDPGTFEKVNPVVPDPLSIPELPVIEDSGADVDVEAVEGSEPDSDQSPRFRR